MRDIARNPGGPRSGREERLSEALKANLKRRKAQRRERSAAEPASAMHPEQAASPGIETDETGKRIAAGVGIKDSD